MLARITAIASDAFTCALVAPTGRAVYSATRSTAERAFNAAVAGSGLNVRLATGVSLASPDVTHTATLPLVFVVPDVPRTPFRPNPDHEHAACSCIRCAGSK